MDALAANSFEAIVAQAEEYMRLGFIKGVRTSPPPKSNHPHQLSGKGRAFEWLCRNVGFSEKKCLFWPFSKNNGHPAAVGYQGKNYKPARLMCLLANGAPPSDKHQAVHTCGRGNKGCIHPKHLAWKTISEARFDEFRRGGRVSYGKRGKLTSVQVAEIRASSENLSAIGQRYGLSPHRVSEIMKGKAYFRPLKTWAQQGRKFYGRIISKGQYFSLGSFASAELAVKAHLEAFQRLQRGEPILPEVRETNSADLRRFYARPAISFEKEGQRIVAIDADQEQSVFLLHQSLNNLHPIVQKLLIIASEIGDLNEAAAVVGLSDAQMAKLLPRLQRHLEHLKRD